MLPRPAQAALGFLLASASASAQGLEIDHSGVGCVVASRFVGIDARLSPAESVGRARVYFKASGTADWYFVEMRQEGATYRGVLPQPRKSTKAIDYYLEVVDTDLQPGRSAEFSPSVVAGPGGCQGGLSVAAALASAKLVVGAATGGAALPAGFSASGVTLAGGATATAGAAGGLSTGLMVGLAVAGAAGAGVAVAAGGSGSGSGSDGPPQTGSGGGLATILGIEIGSPGFLDVSVCAGSSVTFGGGTLSLRSDGSFDETWSPVTPNTLRLTGRADAASLQATLTCAARPGPTGSMTASGSGYNLTGTYSFGGQQGTLSVRRQQ